MVLAFVGDGLMSVLGELETDYERAEALQNILIDSATGGRVSDVEYKELREYFVSLEAVSNIVPKWLKTHRSLSQFWPFIQRLSPTYAGRREFLWAEFEGLLAWAEKSNCKFVESLVSEALTSFDGDGVSRAWKSALDRQDTDPEGAITAGRTLLESVCKHILDGRGVEYDDGVELHLLYRKVSDELNLSPEQHSEKLFKQILGGCSSVVNGLGALRNKLGDAHGKGTKHVRPLPRHARLAVNLAGAMALFLVETDNKGHNERN